MRRLTSKFSNFYLILLLITLTNSNIYSTTDLEIENGDIIEDNIFHPLQSKFVQQSPDIFRNSNYFLLSFPGTWDQAKSNCESLNMHLVTIEDETENNFIRNLISGENVWIGLSDIDQEGNFTWVNQEEVTYTNWNEGQPDNVGLGENNVYMESSGFWFDHGVPENPSFVLPYVCEAEFASSAIGVLDDTYYEYFEINLSWEQAKLNCEQRYGHLVTISDELENEHTNLVSNDNEFWLGFTDQETEGEFIWITGEEVTYTNWAEGEPNNGGNGEDFTVMWPGGVWNDWVTPTNFMCESGNIDGDRFPDHIEFNLGLNPNVNDELGDIDNDGIANIWEFEMGLNVDSNDSEEDLDNDGLTNIQEFIIGSLPNSNDSDLDGMDDFWEVQMGLDPLNDDSNQDLDLDLISNYLEYKEGSRANDLWSVPFFKSEFPFIYLSIPLLISPVIILSLIGVGAMSGLIVKKRNMKKLILQTNSPDYPTALLVRKGNFRDYDQFLKAKTLNVTTLEDYKLILELKEKEKFSNNYENS